MQKVLVLSALAYECTQRTDWLEFFVLTSFLPAASRPSRAPAGKVRTTMYRCMPAFGAGTAGAVSAVLPGAALAAVVCAAPATGMARDAIRGRTDDRKRI